MLLAIIVIWGSRGGAYIIVLLISNKKCSSFCITIGDPNLGQTFSYTMLLSDLFVVFILALTAYMLWQHHAVRGRAYDAALRHTHFHDVLLLDESIVLKRVRIVRSHRAFFALKRHFQFEFSSLGDERYKGEVIFVGQRQTYIQLQAFKTDFKGVPVE